MYTDSKYETVPMREALPPQQSKVLDFIEEFIDVSGYPPSIAEIAEFLGVASTFGVRKHLDALIKKGFLIKGGPGLSRSIMVARPSMNSGGIRRSSSVPIVGRVTAGASILAVEHIEGWLAFKPIKDPQKMFALRVQGESMKDKGIMDGDYVICRQQDDAINGEIIVALLDDSATVKTFRQRGDRYELEPANDAFKPIPITEESGFRVLGKVTSVYRTVDDRKPGLLQLRYN
ncbi:MAG: transcriptional repressor LexA [Bacteroidota bacterium]|nr:transcriptional repressor LexA [Bacteroidota bacterium]MDP4231179.1 transcriptional repressor LexA [Bacteroidota bacterium]MDP4237209.1 transcriptional repressor LexA [Bacteroidota bacterium]